MYAPKFCGLDLVPNPSSDTSKLFYTQHYRTRSEALTTALVISEKDKAIASSLLSTLIIRMHGKIKRGESTVNIKAAFATTGV